MAARPGSSTLLPVPPADPPSPAWRRWRPAVLALLALAAPLVLVALRSRTVALHGKPTEATGLSSRACKEYPYLKIRPPVLYSNLAGRGPDHGNGEGIVYDTIDLGRAAGAEWNREVLMTINATNADNYHPFAARLNGIQGKYASINLMSGSSIDILFHFYDRETREQLTLAEAALTFFDLDTGTHGKSTESITVGGYKHYHVTENTEVLIQQQGDGRTKFSGSTFGVGEDNPVDPMSMTDQQRNRAVSLTFDNLKELFVTLAAGRGASPRFFTFIIRPSLMCGVVVRDPFGTKLPDLNALPPLQVAVEAGEEEQMEGFLVFPGREVKKGDRLAVTLAMNAKGKSKLKTYTSPIDGVVKSVQHDLASGDDLDMRLNNKTIVVIERKVLDALPPAGPGELPAGPGPNTDLMPGATLTKYLVGVNDTVAKGDPIAEFTYNGKTTVVRSQASGVISSRQDALRVGDPIMLVKDMNVMNVGKFPALASPNDTTSRRSAFFGKNQRLKRFKKKAGDLVKKGDVIAVVEDKETGVEMEIKSLHGGVITGMQDMLKPGDDLDRVSDTNLAMVGKLAPLKVDGDPDDQWPTPFGRGQHRKFVGYAVKEGDVVREGQTIAFAKNEDGVEIPIKATKPGVVGALQHNLVEGMDLDEVLQDDNIASLHKLKPLVIQIGEEGSFVPAEGDWKLVDWKVHKGDTVSKGDTIAILKDARTGKEAVVTAGKGGTISELQSQLKKGDLVRQVVPDGNLAVIGKFPRPYVGWPMQVPIKAPSTKVIFNKWLVKEGQLVEASQPVAEVTTAGRRLVAVPGVPCGPLGKPFKVLAPAAGTVIRPLDLRPGMAIEDQALSSIIGVVDMWPPWWLMIIVVLLVLWAVTACLHKVMGKPKRSYAAVGRNSNNERQPNFQRGASGRASGGMLMARANSNRSVGSLGRTCRLDFDDEIGNTRTVQASYRPLGFKHHNEAPISVREFTVNSYGKWELGLQKGWKLTRIGDDVVEEDEDFAVVNDKLENAMKDLAVWPLPLEFMYDAETGDRRVIMFRERPIGIEFKNTRPIQVGKIYAGSPAEREGVEVGWFITRIGEFQVTSHHSLHTVMATMQEGTQFLDDTGEDYE